MPALSRLHTGVLFSPKSSGCHPLFAIPCRLPQEFRREYAPYCTKNLAGNLYDNFVFRLIDFQKPDCADGRFFLCCLGTKTAEIMTSKYMSRCFPHGFDVKRFRHLPRVFSCKDIVCTIWDQMIFVGFSRRIKPAVKPLTRRHYTGNGDVFRQILIDIIFEVPPAPPPHRLLRENCNLCQCVNPGIRTFGLAPSISIFLPNRLVSIASSFPWIVSPVAACLCQPRYRAPSYCICIR